MKKKLKVVWLCNLSNREIQDIIEPHKRVNEYAPWMFMSLGIAEKDSRFEIHVVAPHVFISSEKEFELRGIHYHFYNPYIPVWGHPWPYFFDYNVLTNFRIVNRMVSRIVNRIKPDVIHLYGAENPEYSAAALDLANKYPTILTIQGFMSHSKGALNCVDRKRVEIEQKVIRRIPICFFRSHTQANSVLEFNPKIELLPNTYGSYELKYESFPEEKKYDLVFFARLCKDKGLDDLLEALHNLKSKMPDVSLCIIGGGDMEYYKKMCKALDIERNVIWLGLLPRKDVHFNVVQARISVLPTYHDELPGTIIESMFLGVPVVTYDVDSNPEINENYEAIRLVKVGDIEALTYTLYDLLQDKGKRIALGKAGKNRAYEMFAPSDEQVANQWIKGYLRSIELFNIK